MVSLSSFRFSFPLIRLPLRVGRTPFVAAARHMRLSDLLQSILKPQRKEGCVLLELPDRRLGNLLGNLAEDFAGLGVAILGDTRQAVQMEGYLVGIVQAPATVHLFD